jgi:hypothetical protein
MQVLLPYELAGMRHTHFLKSDVAAESDARFKRWRLETSYEFSECV